MTGCGLVLDGFIIDLSVGRFCIRGAANQREKQDHERDFVKRLEAIGEKLNFFHIFLFSVYELNVLFIKTVLK